MNWELREVGDIETTIDDSGLYVVIHRVVDVVTHKEYSGERVRVRADLMKSHTFIGNDEPIMSFIGSANNVRKHILRFIMEGGPWKTGYLSMEHASYIGYELDRADSVEHYVQD